jgi:hypothetical protein
MVVRLLTRWECRHFPEAKNTQAPGDNGLPRCPFCETARLRGEIARTRLEQGIGTANASRAGNHSDGGVRVMEKDVIDLTPTQIKIGATSLKNLKALTDGQVTMLALSEIVSVLQDIPIEKRIPLTITLRERSGVKE